MSERYRLQPLGGGLYRVVGVRRSALTGMYLTGKKPTIDPEPTDNDKDKE